MTKTAFLFPGQGSQSVGMGKELADSFHIAKETFQEVDDALSEKLSDIIFHGPEDALTLTANTQPALMAVSIAVLRVIETESKRSLAELCNMVAGHSLGEYTALTAAGAMSLTDCTHMLRIRGLAMQKAVPVGQGSMAALIGVDFDQAKSFADEVRDTICEVANDNGGGQVVLSGTKDGIQRVMEIAKAANVKRVVELPVSAPFHCSLMQSAAEKMQEALSTITISEPSVPVIANVTAASVTSPEAIRTHLVTQVTGRVRWRESMETMVAEGVDNVVELGAGKVLAGLAKRINRDVVSQSILLPAQIEAYLEGL